MLKANIGGTCDVGTAFENAAAGQGAATSPEGGGQPLQEAAGIPVFGIPHILSIRELFVK
ncbi:MAG: hypothetical protein VB055_05855 [Oscillospiraceae bacterium]|nr:hypothetical protein [Oscillospiraceae bacterium]